MLIYPGSLVKSKTRKRKTAIPAFPSGKRKTVFYTTVEEKKALFSLQRGLQTLPAADRNPHGRIPHNQTLLCRGDEFMRLIPVFFIPALRKRLSITLWTATMNLK